jgi:hypothetical protein
MKRINYEGKSKILIRIVELLNRKAELGETHEDAGYGDESRAAYEHSLLTSGNPHHVTAADLGLGAVVSQLNAIMLAIGMQRNWITHKNEMIVDHDNAPICFHGANAENYNYLLYH